jgi:Skp family chaperone for outer membrane proteins
MTLRRCSLFGLALLVLTVGCSQPAGNPSQATRPTGNGGVGVVDLDAVAKAIGKDLAMSAEAEQKVAQLNQELAQLQEAMNRHLAGKREELGDDLTDAQKRQLLLAKAKLESTYRDKKAIAERKFARYKQELVGQFREETKPILREVAARRGLSIVIPKNEALLLTVASEVDLTDDVVLEIRKLQPPSNEEPPARLGTIPETAARD